MLWSNYMHLLIPNHKLAQLPEATLFKKSNLLRTWTKEGNCYPALLETEKLFSSDCNWHLQIYSLTEISLLPHILHEVQCLVARNFSFFRLITFYWRFFPIFPPVLLCCFFMGGLLYKFCWWPQESPSSNPNPKPLYRSWPALQISFKHLRLTFLLMNVWANISLLPSEN